MLLYVNVAASRVASFSLPRETVAPSRLVREYPVASPIVSCGSGQRARPASRSASCADSRLRLLFARSRLLALTSSMNADSSASLKLFHQSVFGQTSASPMTGPMNCCGTSLSGSGGGSITAHAPRASSAGTETTRALLFIGQGHYGIKARRLAGRRKAEDDTRRSRAAEREQHRLRREYD